jgi:hypothetical protein
MHLLACPGVGWHWHAEEARKGFNTALVYANVVMAMEAHVANRPSSACTHTDGGDGNGDKCSK